MNEQKSDSEQDYDIQLSFNSGFANKIFSSIPFPWSTEYDLQANTYSFDPIDETELNEIDGSDAVVIHGDVLTESLQLQLNQATHVTNAKTVLTDDIAQDIDNREERDRRYKIDFYKIALTIPTKPKIILGSTIKLDDVTLKVKARFKASIRMFGKDYTTTNSTPWVTLYGRSATLKLSANGAKVMGILELDNIDLVANIKIFKWRYDCFLGLTKVINKHLCKRGPIQLLDLSNFHTTLTETAKPIAIERIDLDGASEQLLIKVFVHDSNTIQGEDEQIF